MLVPNAFISREPVIAVLSTPKLFTTVLWANLQRLNLEMDTARPIYGRIAKVNELRLTAMAK